MDISNQDLEGTLVACEACFKEQEAAEGGGRGDMISRRDTGERSTATGRTASVGPRHNTWNFIVLYFTCIRKQPAQKKPIISQVLLSKVRLK